MEPDGAVWEAVVSDLRALLEKATPGPWRFFQNDPPGVGQVIAMPTDGGPPSVVVEDFERTDDADAVVALRNAASYLLEVVEAAHEWLRDAEHDDPHSTCDPETCHQAAIRDALAALDAHLRGES